MGSSVRMNRMFQEILAFTFTTSGWVLVSSTLPTEYWKVYTLDGALILSTAAYYANLWKICVTDSTGVSDCKDFPSLLALDGYIQACRALMITAVCLGFFGSSFALLGMKCTKIGGNGKIKATMACVAGVNFIVSGLCSMLSCSIYAHQITTEFFDPMFMAQKYELGAALFVGWGGSVLCILGGAIFCFSIRGAFTKRNSKENHIYAASLSHTSSHLGEPTIPVNRLPSLYFGTSPSLQDSGKNSYI
ncbi:uncharacterized protein V6R79_002274 [Siganus canaliculatus]